MSVDESEAAIAKLIGCPPAWVEANPVTGPRMSWDVVPPGVPGVRIVVQLPHEGLGVQLQAKCEEARRVLVERGCRLPVEPS